MKTYELKTELWLPRRRDEVFQFFADPANLEQLTPGWLRIEMISKEPPAMREGIRLDYRLRVHGVRVRWQSEIIAWNPPHYFTDRQTRGPYKLWVHEHTFVERDGGTLVRDNVQYSVPGGALVQRFLVAPDLDQIFRYRHEVLKESFSSKRLAPTKQPGK